MTESGSSDGETKRGEAKVFADIAAYGWHCINVLADQEGPGFAYTIGLQRTLRHPEIIVFGLSAEVMHGILNRIAERIRSGHSHTSGQSYWGILDDFRCHFLTVPQEEFPEYLGWALWYYKDEPLNALQCVWPDRNGKFPWNEGASTALGTRQPIIGVS